MEITVGSLFDGIGGWCIAAERNGAVPIWSSEIEPFCIEVTKKHFPNVMQLGDIKKIKGDKIPPVDIICAGSPCQDLSVAGKREGLNGINSTLVARGPSAVGCIYKNIDCSYVRRLTPLECERLQGLPDNWTEGGSDTARYRAIGNGMAQPCAEYVMSKVVKDLKEET